MFIISSKNIPYDKATCQKTEKVPEQFSHLHELVSLLTHEHEFVVLRPYHDSGGPLAWE